VAGFSLETRHAAAARTAARRKQDHQPTACAPCAEYSALARVPSTARPRSQADQSIAIVASVTVVSGRPSLPTPIGSQPNTLTDVGISPAASDMLRHSGRASEAEVVLAHWYRGNLMSTLLQSAEPARPLIQTSRALSVLPMAAVLVASAGVSFGRPFRSNQNTYLLHAVGPSLSSLRDDWLLHTTDPHPIFTAVAGLASGRVEFAVESFVLMLAAFTGLYLVASTLLRTASRTVRTTVPLTGPHELVRAL